MVSKLPGSKQKELLNNKGELNKMKNEEVLEIMSQKKEPKEKKHRLNQLAGAMVLTVYFLLGIVIIITINDMFDGIATEEVTLFFLIVLMMLVCVLFIIGLSYHETNINNEVEKEKSLRSMLELTKAEYQSKIDYTILENQKAIKNINSFLKEQYKDGYLFNEDQF